ncbi:hypothetical protein V19_54 [Brucella phage V_19]|uniref:Uncharacterized protein n=30 Tax=Perisivirus TaxID=1984798 RepID=H2EI91_9CAUD|nr:single strand DNA binding protein [Brucella phage Tb]YP_007002119.1 single strand DNA binding protein [Brucella phage Pr]AHB81112.1 hypothetical protein Bk_53 [Brucella phage Bk]AHB81170.1 hypothetical protein Fz_54 [Brucella phage Fz]AHB81226.1 hypothetical protein R/C_53 [Brucella phage R/C]AHB81282.1 hypothetical protein S708_53 [Brucella phage S708]AHB81396.1 hypothetical protein Wb_53 [Brucella phage Wb]AKO59042.1 hypothetical protein p0219_54 [Brucella phage 02_19]AKO59100.1 hypoth
MSFWNTSSGESAISNATSFEIEGGGDILPIPAGTKVLAIIENVKIATVKDSVEQYVEIKWGIIKPEVYNKRKIFQKVWCFDYDPMQKDPAKAKAKKDKALKMLAAIDANAGGKLAQAGVEPTDESLALALNNKPMVIGLNTWDDAETKKPKGNWVYYVGPKNDPVTEVTKEDVQAQEAKAKASQPAASSNFSHDLDDEIPF